MSYLAYFPICLNYEGPVTKKSIFLSSSLESLKYDIDKSSSSNFKHRYANTITCDDVE